MFETRFALLILFERAIKEQIYMRTTTPILCKSKYQYGSLTYIVTIQKENNDIDWETDKPIYGEFFFVSYEEPTRPSRNKVGGFKTLEDTLGWVESQFGKLEWEWLEKKE